MLRRMKSNDTGGNKEGKVMQMRIPNPRLGLFGLALVLGLSACTSPPDPAPRLTYAVRDCYKTLADVDCHPRALPGEESRRVGFYDPPIMVEERKAKTWPADIFD